MADMVYQAPRLRCCFGDEEDSAYTVDSALIPSPLPLSTTPQNVTACEWKAVLVGGAGAGRVDSLQSPSLGEAIGWREAGAVYTFFLEEASSPARER